MVDSPICKARRRWFRLTPDRVLVAFLALEGFLLLSEQFAWFAFNRHKGYTVLIAVASVGVAMLLILLWFLAALIFRWRFQYSIRSLLLVTVVVASPCSWMAVQRETAQKQRAVVEELRTAGEWVSYDYQFDSNGDLIPNAEPPAPAWIRRLVGDDFFADPTMVQFITEPLPEKLLPTIGQLPSLTWVDLSELSAASEPFKAISTLPHLTFLELDGTIDFHDLAQIPPMPSVTVLRLREMGERPVPDSACALIAEKFPCLEELEIGRGPTDDNSQPSDKGLAAIRKLPRLKCLTITDTAGITYAGVANFSQSPTLEELSAQFSWGVAGTRVRIHDCPRLVRLDISACQSENAVSEGSWKLILERVPRISEISVEYVNEIRLDSVANLETLTLKHCNVSAANFSELVTGAPLVEVEFRKFKGDLGAALHALSKIPSLKKLDLSDAKLTDAEIRCIGSFKQLEELDLTYNDALNNSTLQQLEGLKHLRVLSVWSTPVTAAGAMQIENVIPGLHCVLVNPIQGGFTYLDSHPASK